MSEPEGPEAEPEPAPDPAATPGPAPLTRLDPDRPAPSAARPATPGAERLAPPEADVDTRRYRWMIGIFGLALVIAISVYQFATHGIGTTGIAVGDRLHFFAAPLANTNLVGDANLSPPCIAARHDPRALNVCLDVRRGPLVLAFFVTGSAECRRSVDALQRVASRLPPHRVQIAAIAVHGSRTETAALIHSHHWTIPVAYDRDGSVGALYGVAICPMLELARRGGTVTDRLIGDRWQTAGAIGPHVRALAATAAGR